MQKAVHIQKSKNHTKTAPKVDFPTPRAVFTPDRLKIFVPYANAHIQ